MNKTHEQLDRYIIQHIDKAEAEMREGREDLAAKLTGRGRGNDGAQPLSWSQMTEQVQLQETHDRWNHVQRMHHWLTNKQHTVEPSWREALEIAVNYVLVELTEHGPAISSDPFTLAIGVTQHTVKRSWLRTAKGLLESYDEPGDEGYAPAFNSGRATGLEKSIEVDRARSVR